ncbi:MAG: hypothetical protein A2169_06405 [Deltaproteobacteria bacterium RBG_13_47_9]|nr:MAG: hypothetical protein A2169_06405 [Deltaproteobacteria bacterium RBG_13_47_9]
MGVKRLKNYVSGQWTESKTHRWLEVRNPAMDEIIAICPESTNEEIDRTVKVAQDAFWSWRSTPPSGRAKLLVNFHEQLQKHQTELVELIVNENGKTLEDAGRELARALEYIEYAFAGPELLKGSYTEDGGTGMDTMIIREPIGPFVFLPSFDFPALISLHFVWAIAAGNTAIVKANRLCPMTITRIFEIADECGFQKGILNLLHGTGSGVGDALVTHPGTVGVTFVGSPKIGDHVYKAAINFGKRAQCQGRAKNLVLIAEDAMIDEAVRNGVDSCFGYGGERWFAASNVLAVDKVYDKVKERFMEFSQKQTLGYGMDQGVTLGPLVSRDALNEMLIEVDIAMREGAKLILDGRNPKVEKYPNGYFIGPTIVEAEPEMHIFQEEVFGPIRCLKMVKDLAEGVDVINQSPNGHTASLYTENGGYARHFARLVHVSQVGINMNPPAPIAYFPAGGRKLSLFRDIQGRLNEAIDFFTDKKAILSRWHSSFQGPAKGLEDGFAGRVAKK